MNFRRDHAVLRILIRQRRAARLAVAAIGGCIALAACGPIQMGAAAIVGGQRITTATLTTQVSDLNRTYHASGGKVQLGFPASQMPQQVLAWLIRFRIGDELASREGIIVTPGDIQRAIAAITAQARQSSSGTSLTDLAVANGLPPDLINSGLGRFEAITNALVARLSGGSSPSSTAAQQAVDQEVSHAQCLAAKSLDIKINPQFGRFDYSQLGIVASANTLSAPGPAASPSASPTASPSATPQFSPSC
jgi:peptidyl-prolyl cis-trans isomerase SurA